jgi:hypothetical protein
MFGRVANSLKRGGCALSARVALAPRFHAEISAPCVHLYSISLIVRLVGTIELRGKTFKPGNIFRITRLNILLLSWRRSLPAFAQHLIATKMSNRALLLLCSKFG